MAEKVLLSVEDRIATVSLNRPEAYNALDPETMEQMAHHLMTITMDPAVRVIILTGAGKAFCSGGDLRSMQQPGGAGAGIHRLAALFHQSIIEIRRTHKPVIAAVNGAAAGGGFSLALACDFRVMAKNAVLKQAYTSSGLVMDGGGSFTLPRIVGLARALELAAFDAPINAEQALAWGLATRICEEGKALESARLMAVELANKAIHAFGATKQLFNDSFSTTLESHLEKERRGIETAADGPEGQEGITAFAAKRKPVFG